MTIDSAQRQIDELLYEIEELRVKIMACDRVVSALTEDLSTLENLKNKDSTVTTFVGNVTTSSSNGEQAFIRGAYYVGQTEGNSKSFNDIFKQNNEILGKLNNLLNLLENKKGDTTLKISVANNAKINHQNHIEYCTNQINSLRQWIEDERRRQEEEARRQREAQNTRNSNNWNSYW